MYKDFDSNCRITEEAFDELVVGVVISTVCGVFC